MAAFERIAAVRKCQVLGFFRNGEWSLLAGPRHWTTTSSGSGIVILSGADSSENIPLLTKGTTVILKPWFSKMEGVCDSSASNRMCSVCVDYAGFTRKRIGTR